MLKRLIRQEWWTQTTVKTDADGWAQVEAFKGDYEISCGQARATVSLSDDVELIAVGNPVRPA